MSGTRISGLWGWIILVVIVVLVGSVTASGKVIYVDGDASFGGNGQNWATSYRYLQDALAVAVSGDEIKVAEGIYKPDRGGGNTPGNRYATFLLKNGVLITGGYAGFGEPQPDAWDIDVYETLLSGDLLGNDGPDSANNGENSYHVVTGSGTNVTAVLDGLTITGGNANVGSDIPAGIISHWKFDEAQGSIAYDSAGNNHGIVYGAQWTTGQIDGALYFDGLNDYVMIPNESYFDITGRITLAVWIKVNSLDRGWQAIITKGDWAWRLQRSRENNVIEFALTWVPPEGGYGNIVGRGNINDGRWHHICGTYDGAHIRLYMDGVEDSASPAAYSGGISTNNYNVLIGENAQLSGRYWNGLIDDVRIYVRALSAGEVQGLYSMSDNRNYGGGMYNESGNPTLSNCTFSGNSASESGGGMFNYNNSSPTVTNCTFKGNSMEDWGGGGMANWESSSPTVTNCTFSGNSAEWGGGMYNWEYSSPTLVNCTFSDNSSDVDGGGMFNRSSSSATVTNCILWGNTAPSGPQIYNDGTSWAIVGYSDVQGGWPGAGNINADPLFVDPAISDYHLLPGSPCIDAGDNSAVPPSVVTDLDGNYRIANGTVDMGVYEFGSTPASTLFVDARATGASNGNSWVDAFADLQEALTVATAFPQVEEIRVAQGAYSPEGPLPDIRQATNPNPADGAITVNIIADLSWTAGSDATSHDVYFGTTSPGIFQGNQTATTFDPGTMAYSTTYYWRIDEVGPSGTTTGAIWSFSTLSAPPPMGSNESLDNTVTAGDRTATFQLINGVAIYGGYAGFGEPNADARDIELYETILSGDLAGNDMDVHDPCDLLTEPSRAENSYHVVSGSDCNESAVLDGFTITAGNANSEGYPFHRGSGGGIQIRFGSMEEKGPVLTNCTFIGNSARGGGGMDNDHCSTTLTNCTFSENFAIWGGGIGNDGFPGPKLVNCTFTANRAGYKGGAIANAESRPTLENCTLIANHAEMGGAIYNGEASIILTNCTLIGNSAETGGAVYNNDSSVKMTNCMVSENSCTEEGGVVYLGSDDGAALTNCILTANSAEKGGVVYVGDDSYARLTNCTVTGNWATDNGGALYFDGPDDARATITNCILWNNTPQEIYPDLLGDEIVITYNDVQGGWPGQGNINVEPCFVDAGYWDANGVWIDGNYHLLQTSACINAGDNNSLPADTQDLDGDSNTTEPIPFDLDGNPRIVYDVVDMGAFEFDNTAPIADAGDDQTIECACNTAQGTKVTLDGSNASDSDGGLLTYIWIGPFVESPANGAAPTVTLEEGCPGDYVITLVVDDGIDESEPNEVMIRVVDTTPPAFEFSVAPAMLWPPDHKMVEITPSWTVSDDCDTSPDVSLVSIAMNEGDNTIGDGHTSNDIQIGEDGSIYLRSERSGTSDDRVYTITYQAVDDCGNTTLRSATVSIPHDFKVLARIAARWLWAGPGRIPEDLNGDGVVNLKDIAIFANNWIQ